MALASPTTRPPCALRGPALRAALQELRHENEAAPPSVAESPRAAVGSRFEDAQEVWDRGPQAMGPRDLARWLEGRPSEPSSGVRQRDPEP
jgi:hypothetical protein